MPESHMKPVPPSKTWSEKIIPGEQELFERFANSVIAAQQKEVAEQTDGTLLRGFHAKTHAGLVAEFRLVQ